jgi:hypothetical protein
MQTFTLTTGSWLRRLVARNPLLRASDRLEAAALLVLLIVTVLAVPIAGAVGTAVYDARIHAFAAQRPFVHEVDATATGDTTISRVPYQSSFLTPLKWHFEGRDHTDAVFTPKAMKTGQDIPIWVDETGTPTAAPRSGDDAVAEGAIIALGLWATVAGACGAALALLQHRLVRLRHAGWDRALDKLAADGGRRNHNA